MALKDFTELVTVVVSPALTLLAAAIGWVIIIKDSRSSAQRTEATELLNLVVDTTVNLNRRGLVFFLKIKSIEPIIEHGCLLYLSISLL